MIDKMELMSGNVWQGVFLVAMMALFPVFMAL
jgi:hypothetical protein